MKISTAFVCASFLFQFSCFGMIEEEERDFSSSKIVSVYKEDELEVLKGIEKKREDSKLRILFLCAGNATRSQLAEGWAKSLGGDSVELMSAGLNPRPLNPKAIQVMEESGVDIKDHSSKKLNDSMIEWADLVITTCNSSDEQCPMLPKGTSRLHWSIEAPAIDFSDEEAVLNQVRTTSNAIQLHTLKLLNTLRDLNHIK